MAFTPYTADVGVRRTEYQHLSSCTTGTSHTAKVLFQGLWQVRNFHLQLVHHYKYKTKEISVLFNDMLNTFYLRMHSLQCCCSFQPVLQDWCNKGHGMCYPVCGMVHIKDLLLLIKKSSPCGGGLKTVCFCIICRYVYVDNQTDRQTHMDPTTV